MGTVGGFHTEKSWCRCGHTWGVHYASAPHPCGECDGCENFRERKLVLPLEPIPAWDPISLKALTAKLWLSSPFEPEGPVETLCQAYADVAAKLTALTYTQFLPAVASPLDKKMIALYKIPYGNLAELKARIEKLSLKAVKLGCAPIELELTGETGVQSPAPGQHVNYAGVQLKGQQPKLAGWSFVGTINHLPDGNIVRPLPGVKLEQKYQTVPAWCDQCQVTRKRNDSFIVRHDKLDGDVFNEKQVGRSCLADFLGHQNPHHIAKFAELLAVAVEACTSAEKSTGTLDPHPGTSHKGTAKLVDLHSFLAHAAWAIRTHGWVSKKAAHSTEKNLVSTAAFAYNTFFGGFSLPKDATVEDYLLADGVIEWAEALAPANEYEEAIKVVVGSGSGAFDVKQVPLVTSAANYYPKYMEQAIQAVLAAQQQVGPWLAEVGAKVDVHLKFVKRTEFQNSQGPGVLLWFTDQYVRSVKVFSSAAKAAVVGFQLGNFYRVVGVVQEHNEWKNYKSTILKGVEVITED